MRLRSDQGLWLGTSETMMRFALAVEVLIYVARGSSPLTSTILATNTLARFGLTTAGNLYLSTEFGLAWSRSSSELT
jgi:hypothetical protein